MTYSSLQITEPEYNGTEYNFTSPLPDNEYFSIIPENPLPALPSPIIDEESGLCIGYANERGGGIYDIYDIQGNLVTIQEIPLETSLIDPLDVVFLGALIFKGIRLGFHSFEAISTRGKLIRFSSSFTNQLIGVLRGKLKFGLSPKALKFTTTPAQHMSEPSRYIPVYILEKAVRYGKRMPDVKGNSGRILKKHEIRIKRTRLNKKYNPYENKEYNLEVIIDESSWTITHFQYQ